MEDSVNKPIYKKPIGGLNTSASLSEVPPMDFIDGYDIVDRNPRARNEEKLLQPNSNTELAYNLGEAEATEKVYRVTMDLTGLGDCDILFNATINGLFYNYEITPVSYTTGDDAATLFSNIETIFNGVPNYDDTIFTLVSDTDFLLVFDIAIPFYGYTDYILSVENSLGDSYDLQVLTDAVSVDKEGRFYPVRFENINNDQQVFATTNTKKPQTLVADATYTSALFLEFAADPEINDGDEVYIYSLTGGVGQISAIVTLRDGFAPLTYEVVGTSNVTISPSGSYAVVKNIRSLSVIGYAKKNNILNEWNYTELLRSNKLNFRAYNQIQGALNVTSDGLIYDWTDFLNPIRRLIYKGNIVDGGFLTVYNSEALYDLDSIEQESRLQIGENTSKVSLFVATKSGSGGRVGYVNGAKKEACYAAFVSFKTQDGVYTNYSKASNVLWLHSNILKSHSYGYNSGKVLQIKIEQIPYELYEYVRVSIIEFTENAWVGYSLPDIQINGQDTLYVSDSGFNTESYLDFNAASTLLEQIPFVFENAKSILSYNNYLLAANVNLYQEYDLTDWAASAVLTPNIKRTLLGSDTTISNIENSSYNFQIGVNAYIECSTANLSYMPYDRYRFYLYVDWENGSPTSTYPMGELDFDPDVTGLSASPIEYDSSNYYWNQLYAEVTGIDMSYVLPDGKVLRDVVKDIRFGREICNRQVYTTGFGMKVYDDGGGNDYVSGFNDGANTVVDTKLALYSPDFQNSNQQFTFESGDKLSTMLTTRDGGGAYGSNYAYLFTGGFSSTPEVTTISSLENVVSQSENNIALFEYTNSGTIIIRDAAAVELNSAITEDPTSSYLFYYLKPYPVDGAYPLSGSQSKSFVLPQNQWYDKNTHDSSTVYEIYGGDAFPTINAYKIAENTSSGTTNNAMAVFYCYSRTNTALRSGRFPFYTLTDYLENPYLGDPTYEKDRYTYNNCFTPRYPFQNKVAFNPLLPQYTNQFSSLYYSGQGIGADLAGGNRVWLPLNFKAIESKYGAITNIDILLGQIGTNILIVWQERRITAQYFDNTANLVSNAGQLILGTGAILEREGQNFTEFGSEHKWAITKGQTATGKDVVFWACFRKNSIMRFGADGTSSIVADISYLLNNKTILAINNSYNNNDEPAFFNGVHAVWDNLRKEYILTLRLYPKCIESGVLAMKGDFLASPDLTWGFERFPVIYESLIDNNNTTPPNQNWRTHSGYDSDYFELVTFVWNEIDNKYKTYRSYLPKIYGQFNGNYVSSHPIYGNLIYEHNGEKSEAIYYAVEVETAVTATTDPSQYRITGIGIQSTFPSPFEVKEREKYIVTINGKNYEVVDTGTNYLQMANVDDDDILPQATIYNFSYFIANSQDPYIEAVANENNPMYVQYSLVTTKCDQPLKKTEFESGLGSLTTKTVSAIANKSQSEYYQGTSNTQIPTSENSEKSTIDGYWMKFKNVWRWGLKNRVELFIINYINIDKKV